ncbi:MAG: hypothetical protein JWR37_3730 [Mycobacterium sp.]|nr:hypothetical protein [Mycobacterium sp.]
MSDRRREITAGYPGRAIPQLARTATMDDPEALRRDVLHQHLERIVVHSHPGLTKPPPDWPGRAAQMLRRLDIHWTNGGANLRGDLPALPTAATSTTQPVSAAWTAPRQQARSRTPRGVVPILCHSPPDQTHHDPTRPRKRPPATLKPPPA